VTPLLQRFSDKNGIPIIYQVDLEQRPLLLGGPGRLMAKVGPGPLRVLSLTGLRRGPRTGNPQFKYVLPDPLVESRKEYVVLLEYSIRIQMFIKIVLFHAEKREKSSRLFFRK